MTCSYISIILKSITKYMQIFSMMLMAFYSYAAPASYDEAKRIAKSIFTENPVTLFCGCEYNQFYQTELASCNMESARGVLVSRRIDWAHLMPVEHFGSQFKCWHEPLCEKNGKQYSGRNCCNEINFIFRAAEAELYNIWPVVGLVNRVRANHQYARLTLKRDFYGCPIEVSDEKRKFEPSDRAKGIVARANLFMSYQYNIRLSKEQKTLFQAWNRQYPPTLWEISWANSVANIEGYENPYITQHITQR